MTHLSREELLRWRDRGATDDRDRVVSHLAACGSCATAYAELTRIATPPVAERPTHFDPADFVARGYAVQRRMRPSRSMLGLSWKVWAGALSAAAVLLVIVTLGPEQGGDVSRGATIGITAPTAVTDHPEIVTWTSGIAATRFRVELVDSDGAPVFQTITNTSRVVLPDDRRAALSRGHSYTWKITALDKDNQPIMTGAKTFAIAGSDAK
jgi:hypothetical protein